MSEKLECLINKVNIWFGSNENAILSNISTRIFLYDNMTYYSVEHAYQTLKSGRFNNVTYYKYHHGDVKIIGASKVNKNISLSLMKELILESLNQNYLVKMALLDTGMAKLTHTQDRGIWRIEFPRILMELRDMFQRGVNI